VCGGRVAHDQGHGLGEALAEENGELGLGQAPLTSGHGPLVFGSNPAPVSVTA
jgi:hypothetical protein